MAITTASKPVIRGSSPRRPARRNAGKIMPCKHCGKDFKVSSSGSLQCSACRYARESRPCGKCGERERGRKAKYCKNCREYPLTKNGRTGHTKGYVYVRAKDHPRAGKNGYVLEHILVMEQKIGRTLLPGENIHHRNGVKNDNRPENLELWVSQQPSGQRPEDLVGWAVEILGRYSPDLLK